MYKIQKENSFSTGACILFLINIFSKGEHGIFDFSIGFCKVIDLILLYIYFAYFTDATKLRKYNKHNDKVFYHRFGGILSKIGKFDRNSFQNIKFQFSVK